MHKVAIIKTSDRYTNYEDSEVFVYSITDWVEVDEETLNLLRGASILYNFKVIEQPRNQGEFIGKMVKDYKDYIEKKELEKIELAAKKKRDAEEKLRLKNLSEKERKRELFRRLQEEYEAGQL